MSSYLTTQGYKEQITVNGRRYRLVAHYSDAKIDVIEVSSVAAVTNVKLREEILNRAQIETKPCPQCGGTGWSKHKRNTTCFVCNGWKVVESK